MNPAKSSDEPSNAVKSDDRSAAKEDGRARPPAGRRERDRPRGDLAARYAREPVWAVVGASNDRTKYGNRIYRTLRAAGYRVYAVNDHQERIEGDRAYPSLLELPEPPTVVDVVIPPNRVLPVARDAVEVGARALWFQPGAESEAAASHARQHGLDVIHDCILRRHVQLGGRAEAETDSGAGPSDQGRA